MSYYLCGEDLAHGAVGPFKSMSAAAKWHEFQAARGDASATFHKDSQFIITGEMIRNNPKYKDYLMNCCTPEQDLEVNGGGTHPEVSELSEQIDCMLDQRSNQDAAQILGVLLLDRCRRMDDNIEPADGPETNWDSICDCAPLRMVFTQQKETRFVKLHELEYNATQKLCYILDSTNNNDSVIFHDTIKK